MPLRREILRPEAGRLFDILGGAPEMAQFTLMGGTALALQIGHRMSLDFDFAVFGDTLPRAQLDQMISRLKQEGHQAQLITSPEQTSGFKINTGLNLLDFARDYVIDGVRVTFFVHGKNEAQKAFYQSTPKIAEHGLAFSLMAIDGLKTAETLVLADRVRSRDLYDLFILTRNHGYSLENLFDVVTRLGTIDDPEHYKAVMRGLIPIDREDEGLEPVVAGADLTMIYSYFNSAIDAYETRRAREFFAAG